MQSLYTVDSCYVLQGSASAAGGVALLLLFVEMLSADHLACNETVIQAGPNPLRRLAQDLVKRLDELTGLRFGTKSRASLKITLPPEPPSRAIGATARTVAPKSFKASPDVFRSRWAGCGGAPIAPCH